MKIRNPLRDLSKFEMLLWITSAVMIIGSFLFSGGDNILTIITSLIGVTALIFVAKGYIEGQVLTVVFSVFYGIVSFFLRYYGEMITYLCMTAPSAVITIISWTKHPYEGTKEVEVSSLTKNKIIAVSILSILITIAFYFILSALGNASILFSTISVTTSFIASSLMFLRSPYYAIGYAANDLILIVLWIIAGINDISYLPMVACFVVFLANDLYGFYNWRRMEKNQSLNKNSKKFK